MTGRFTLLVIQIAKMRVMNPQLAQSSQQLGDVNIFFRRLYREASEKAFG